MARILLPRLGKGQVALSGVVFTDGAAEADLGPNLREYLELIGAVVIGDAEELEELTLDELHDLADRAGEHLASHVHKADAVAQLAGRRPVDHAAEAKGSQIDDVDEQPAPQEPAGDVETPPTADDTTPTENAPEDPAEQRTAADAEHEEEQTWSPSLPSTTSPTTTGSLSLQERRRMSSQGDSSEPPLES